ncbi:hypothetical protein BDZ97DRAFT_1341916 [Flammula alnicola]|nr:hypothetical protein BDZ97DRAFT_1341916 [Flammula alnicola]
MDQAPADASIDSQASATTDPAASTLAELPLTRTTRNGNDIEASKAVSTAPLAADGDNTTSAAPAAASFTSAKPAVVAVTKLAPIINPDMLFGPPTGPSTRLNALMSEKATAPAITGSTAPATLNTTPKDAPTVGMKRVTASTSAKNLCYIAYLEDHEPISCAAFEDYYKKLPKDEIKNWNSKSRLAKLTPA